MEQIFRDRGTSLSYYVQIGPAVPQTVQTGTMKDILSDSIIWYPLHLRTIIGPHMTCRKVLISNMTRLISRLSALMMRGFEIVVTANQAWTSRRVLYQGKV